MGNTNNILIRRRSFSIRIVMRFVGVLRSIYSWWSGDLSLCLWMRMRRWRRMGRWEISPCRIATPTQRQRLLQNDRTM